jgi:hypothetical protein
MATRPTLPYYASPETLPAPLPRVASIVAWKQFFKTFQPGTKVIHFSQHYVVKYGEKVRLQEGENMLFVQQSTSIRVPTVYALFHDEKTGIVQEYIPGQHLRRVWKTFGASGKQAIATQLTRYFDELRALPSPGYFGGIWGQRTLDFYLGSGMDASSSSTTDEHKFLPCTTEKEWVDNMLAVGKIAHAFDKHPDLVSFFAHAFHSVFQGHAPVFTHTDLHSTNILVGEDGTLALIDWERAGWYPRFWEYCCVITAETWEDDWSAWVPRFLDEHLLEVGWMFKFRDWILINSL